MIIIIIIITIIIIIPRLKNTKIEKYQDLKRELKRIWQRQEIVTIPIIIGTLGTVSKNFEQWLRKLDIMVNFSTLQKACLLGSARVLRKVLDT